jgi:hypothetical protein
MSIVLGIIGIAISLVLLKYRERVGDLIGEADWMNKVGGVYNLVIIVSVLLFFWSVAVMTGTTGILLRPLIMLLPGTRGAMQQQNTTPDFIIE